MKRLLLALLLAIGTGGSGAAPVTASLTINGLIDDPFNPLRFNPPATEPCTYQGPLAAFGDMYCGLARGDVYTASWDDAGGGYDDFHFQMNRVLIDDESPGFRITLSALGVEFACCTDGRNLMLTPTGWNFNDSYSGGFIAGTYTTARSVPEPGTRALVALALAAGWLALTGRRREKAQGQA